MGGCRGNLATRKCWFQMCLVPSEKAFLVQRSQKNCLAAEESLLCKLLSVLNEFLGCFCIRFIIIYLYLNFCSIAKIVHKSSFWALKCVDNTRKHAHTHPHTCAHTHTLLMQYLIFIQKKIQ